jgi:hypothetical protein
MKPYIERASTLIFAALLLFCAAFAHAQTVSPFMALGNAQFFDNNGILLTSGVLYSYQAGTTTQQATYTDYTGATQNPNPIPFGSGARVAIWLTSTASYKFVLCAQNDGASCAPSDVLFSIDHVPGCLGCSTLGNVFTGTFISGTANPASAGILELASIDSICWRNAANSTNLCISKDTSDVLTWTGATTKFPETSCTAGAVNEDYLCPNAATHHLSANNNNVGYGSIPVILTAGVSGHLAGLASNGIDVIDSGGTPPASTAVTFSATPTFTATSQDQLFTMTLTGNVTGSTLIMTGLPAPSIVSFELTQDATGGRTFVWPSNVIGAAAPTATAAAVSLQQFIWDGTNAHALTIQIPPTDQHHYITTLSTNVTLTANTPNTILTQAVTMPTTGCPCRAITNYMVYIVGNVNGSAYDAWVTDGTASWGSAQTYMDASGREGGLGISAFSEATYANSASVTFTLKVQDTQGNSVFAISNAGAPQHSWMSIDIVTSN